MARQLQSVPLFDGLSRRERKKALEDCSERSLQRGHVLVKEGTSPEELYVLLSGAGEAVRRDRRGTEYVLREVIPGELVGEVAVLEHGVCAATVRLTEDSKVLALPGALARRHPGLVVNVARALSDKVRVHSDLSLEHAR